MARRSKPTVYPWGTGAPSVQIKIVSKNALNALDKAQEPGFAHAHRLASAAVLASRPLTETLEHLAFRPATGTLVRSRRARSAR